MLEVLLEAGRPEKGMRRLTLLQMEEDASDHADWLVNSLTLMAKAQEFLEEPVAIIVMARPAMEAGLRSTTEIWRGGLSMVVATVVGSSLVSRTHRMCVS